MVINKPENTAADKPTVAAKHQLGEMWDEEVTKPAGQPWRYS
jgi:hypothetical protein